MVRILRLKDEEMNFLRFALESKLNEIGALLPNQEEAVQKQMRKEEYEYMHLLKKVRIESSK